MSLLSQRSSCTYPCYAPRTLTPLLPTSLFFRFPSLSLSAALRTSQPLRYDVKFKCLSALTKRRKKKVENLKVQLKGNRFQAVAYVSLSYCTAGCTACVRNLAERTFLRSSIVSQLWQIYNRMMCPVFVTAFRSSRM